MLFDVYNQDAKIVKQVEADDITEAWYMASKIDLTSGDIVQDVRLATTPVIEEVIDAEKKIYTFVQPVREGYYYIAVLAQTDGEAFITADSIAFANKTDRLRKLSEFNQEELVVESSFKVRMVSLGYAHRFVTAWPPPYHERAGHYGFPPD